MALSPKDSYLVLYNLCCCAGWAYVLMLGLQTIVNNGLSASSLASIYAEPGLATTLTYVQSAAMMEIVHAAIGFVRSPVFITTLQVGSRIAALFAIVNSPNAGGKFKKLRYLYICIPVRVYIYMA
jgi:very-long-chain (3R)-3-hydroxyacyl-CoA dehydratase